MADGGDEEDKRSLLEELAVAAVKYSAVGRPAQTSYVKVEQGIYNSIYSFLNWPCQFYLTGSMYEGMPRGIYNDMDTMLNFPFFPNVVWDHQPHKLEANEGGYVVGEQNKNEPAYLRIRIGDSDTAGRLSPMIGRIIDADGYLKCANFVDYLKGNNEEEIKKGNVTGPALTVSKSTTELSRRSNKNEGTHSKMDMVYCLKCQSWPSITQAFFNRTRPTNWPSKELLVQTISSTDCLVVAVGHPCSAWKETEWRLSFSVAETKLVHEMFQPYFECMLALKSINNRYFIYDESVKPKPFCSYFIKTACFWMSENVSYTDFSIMDLIRKILEWIIDCYKLKNLPHYFIPQQNLIGHLSTEACDAVVTKLVEISKHLWTKLMSCFINKSLQDTIINPLCNNLMIERISGESSYGILKENLMKLMRSKEEIGKAIMKLDAKGEISRTRETLSLIDWTVQPFNSLIVLMQYILNSNYNLGDVLRIPEKFVLPMIEKINDVVWTGFGKTLKLSLFRFLGSIYMNLLLHLRKLGIIIPAYQEKPLHYYSLGFIMEFPNNLSDEGIGGLALILKYYYVMRDFQSVKALLSKFESLLGQAKEKIPIIYQWSYIRFDTRMYIAFGTCAVDEDIHQLVFEHMGIIVHPIVLSLYIQAKVALEEDDIETVAKVLHNMDDCMRTVLKEGVITSTLLMIDIINKLIIIREFPFKSVDDIVDCI